MPFLVDAHHVGSRQTGNETWIRNITRELVAQADPDEIEVAASASGSEEVADVVGRRAHVVADSAFRRLGVDLPRLARRVAAEAVLVQYTAPLSRVPAVVMVHDLSAFDPEAAQWLSRRLRARVRLSIRDASRRAAYLLAPSEFTRRQLVERLGVAPERVVVSVNAVDPALARLIDTANPADADPAVFRVLAVGNVLPRKNLLVLAKAVAALRAERSDVVLRIVGSVRDAGRSIAAEIAGRLGDSVTFTGYVDDDQLAAEYVRADALAFPSLFEGFGIPALEAMYAGVPVVVSDSTSLPEVVGDAGVVVPPSDVDAWVEALRALRDDAAAREALSAAGRGRAASFTWADSAVAVLGALRGAARPERRPA